MQLKKAARTIVEKYYSKLTLDFQINKKISEEVATIPSKRLRNKIAGFATHLMKRIQRGPVRGISLKLQEEERERRMEYVPDRSEVDTDHIQVPIPVYIYNPPSLIMYLGVVPKVPGTIILGTLFEIHPSVG